MGDTGPRRNNPRKIKLEWRNNISIMDNFNEERLAVKIIQSRKQFSPRHQLIEDGSGHEEVGDGMEYMELLKIVIH